MRRFATVTLVEDAEGNVLALLSTVQGIKVVFIVPRHLESYPALYAQLRSFLCHGRVAARKCGECAIRMMQLETRASRATGILRPS